MYTHNQHSPVADPSTANTCMVISNGGGLERTSTGCSVSFSSTMYINCSNPTDGAVKHKTGYVQCTFDTELILTIWKDSS